MVEVYPPGLGGRSPLVGCALTSGGYLRSRFARFNCLNFVSSFFCLFLVLTFLLTSAGPLRRAAAAAAHPGPRDNYILDRPYVATVSTRPSRRRGAPGRGGPVADYLVMDHGMVGDIVTMLHAGLRRDGRPAGLYRP